MKSFSPITRIGNLMFIVAGLGLAVPPAFGWDDVGRRTGEAGMVQEASYDVIQVSQPNGFPQRFSPQASRRSDQIIQRVTLKQDRHYRDSLRHNRSRTFIPLILYPWVWGYHYGDMQTPEDVLIEYLEDLNLRQEMAREEELPAPPPLVQTSPPLIIEERCGKYVQVPWPESGVLFEPMEEPACP